MPAHRKQFCLRGHDTHLVGRTKGACNSCNKERKTSWRKTENGKASHRRYYAKNREHLREAMYEARAARSELIAKIKTDAGCADDAEAVALDFDHVRGEKLFSIGFARGSGKSLEVILEEIAKCDVVCSNCHRIRTRDRLVRREL